jgi:formamidopyrimidine-DNA glycosylase
LPELPEVETTRRGIAPHVVGKRIARVVVRDRRLRFGISPALERELAGLRVAAIERRGKYLLLRVDEGAVVIHLGMSGSLRIVTTATPPRPHDHVDFVFDDGSLLRFHDPRRFGSVLHTRGDPHLLVQLSSLGPEPFDPAFDSSWLEARAARRPGPIKSMLMDNAVVVGVGNIYANEALFEAGIHPLRAASRVSRARYERLATSVRAVLARAIDAGGTTLRDYVNGAGEPGYFALQLAVYGRAGEACRRCGATVRLAARLQRATFYCPHCQR